MLGKGQAPSGSRSFRTYMSIENRVVPIFKVREDLNNERRS